MVRLALRRVLEVGKQANVAMSAQFLRIFFALRNAACPLRVQRRLAFFNSRGI